MIEDVRRFGGVVSLATRLALVVGLAAPGVAWAQPILVKSFSANEEISGAFGGSVGGIADLDDDGRGDFVVGAPSETSVGLVQGGRVYVYSGRIGERLFTIESPRNEEFGGFGWAVAGVPDTNLDGRGDFAIGAPNENPNLPTDCGRAYLYSGDGTLRFILGSPATTLGANGRFGFSVAGVPDVNSDGKGDLIVGAPGETATGSPAGAGRAHVYSGNGGKIHTLKAPVEQAGLQFGWSVAGVPDATGDLRGDVIVGAPFASGVPPVNQSGRAFLYNGRFGTLVLTFQSPNQEVGGRFGHSVAGVPDANGDGRGDVVIGAPYEDPGLTPNSCGRVYLFSGATGLLIRMMAPPQAVQNGRFGISVAGTLDANNDLRGDIIVGAPGENAPGLPGAGRIHIFSGATGARLASPVSMTPEFHGAFGMSVAGVPDANLNTRSDAVAGAPAENPGTAPTGAGRAYLVKF